MSTFAWPNIAGEAPPAAQLDGLREAAREEGYAAGLAQAQSERDERQRALAAALQNLENATRQLGGAQEQAIVDLAFASLAALLRVELTTNPAVLSNLVAEALATLDAQLQAVQILVNPEDLPQLEAVTELPLVADPSVPAAGVRVTLPERAVEFDLLGRLKELAS